MAQLTKAAFLAKYNDVSTGLFRSGQSAGAITEVDEQTLVIDTKDSAIWPDSALTTGCLVYSTGTNTVLTDANIDRDALADQVSHLIFSGTMPSVITGQTQAFRLNYTSAGSSSFANGVLLLTYNAGYTGSSLTWGIRSFNSAAGTGATLIPAAGTNTIVGNMGVQGDANATTTGTNMGGKFAAQGGNVSVGVLGLAQVVKNSATNIGGAFSALNTGSSGIEVGVWASLNQETVPTESAAAIFDNDSQTADILQLKDNGTTVFKVADGGIATALISLNIGGNSTAAGILRIYEDTDNGTNFSAFQVGTQSGDITYTLPTAAPTTDGQVLASTTGGVMSWGSGSGELRYIERTITSAEILNMNSVPVELVAAGGANVAMALIGIFISVDYAGVAYATNTTLEIRHGSSNYGTNTSILTSTADRVLQFFDSNHEYTTLNNNINLDVAAGNPTAGTSDIKVKLWYTAVTI